MAAFGTLTLLIALVVATYAGTASLIGAAGMPSGAEVMLVTALAPVR